MKQKEKIHKSILESIADKVLIIGVLGSIFFMVKIGSNQKSFFLFGLFLVWVLSPFTVLYLINKNSTLWSVGLRKFIHWTMILISIVSLIAYSGIFKLASTKPSFPYIVFPFLSWLVILIGWFIAKLLFKKGNKWSS